MVYKSINNIHYVFKWVWTLCLKINVYTGIFFIFNLIKFKTDHHLSDKNILLFFFLKRSCVFLVDYLELLGSGDHPASVSLVTGITDMHYSSWFLTLPLPWVRVYGEARP